MTTHKFFTVEIAFCPNNLNSEDIKNLLYSELGVVAGVHNWDDEDESEAS